MVALLANLLLLAPAAARGFLGDIFCDGDGAGVHYLQIMIGFIVPGIVLIKRGANDSGYASLQ